MLALIAERAHLAQAAGGHQQARSGVAHAERPEALELAGEIHPDALAADSDERVEVVRPHELRGIDLRRRVRDERLPKGVEVGGIELETGRGAVAAVATEVLGGCVEGGDQVEAGDAPGGALGSIAVDREQDRGPEVALDHPRCGDADDAGVPSLAGQDQRGSVPQGLRQSRAGALCPLHHLLLGPAALGVGPIELVGDRGGAIAVIGEHQLDPGVRPVEAPGGVDAWGESEAEGAGVDGLRIDGGRGHQGAQPDSGAVAHEPEALAHQAAVLADQGDHVRDGRQRHHVEVAVAGVAAAGHGLDRPMAGGIAESDGELVRDAGGTESLEGILGDDRVDHRAVREALPGQVVVGDHDLDSRGRVPRPPPRRIRSRNPR